MSDLHVWEPPDDWTDEDMEEWIRDAGGREIVLRRTWFCQGRTDWEACRNALTLVADAPWYREKDHFGMREGIVGYHTGNHDLNEEVQARRDRKCGWVVIGPVDVEVTE